MSPILFEAIRDTLTAVGVGLVIGLLLHPSLLFGRKRP